MLPEVTRGGENNFSAERPIGPSDMAPIERMFVGSTETIGSREALLTAEYLQGNIDFINHLRFRSEVVQDEKTGLYMPPTQIITTAVTTDEATAGIIGSGYLVHAQLPPLDALGRASGEWELALIKRKGEKQVATDPTMYTRLLSQDALSPHHKLLFSMVPPREGRPFPRLTLRHPTRRAA